MSQPHPSLYADLEYRGLVKQVTDPELASELSKRVLTLYAGFDPTADALHVGSLLPLVTMRRFQNAGHKLIAVVGGSTGMVGDPSGKSAERALQSDAQINANLAGIKACIERILTARETRVVNNADWTRDVSVLDFLRDVGKHFTVNHMMAKESVRARLEDREHGISYTEFSYMLLQSWDYYVLNRDYGCELQIGGSDQWGNITAGIELIRRKSDAKVYGLTHPLVMKADGTKFGKTEAGTIWLTPERTTPYAFYQFFVQTADADVVTFLKYFTFLPRAEIERLETCVEKEPEKREAQKVLAREVTALVHGEAAVREAEAATQALFSGELGSLSGDQILSLAQGAPQTSRPRAQVATALIDLLVETGLCASKGAARKEISGGGIYLNQARVSDAAYVLTPADILAERYTMLRKGKKTYHLIVWT